MRGMRAHQLLKESRFIDRVVTARRYKLLVYDNYPGLVAGDLSIEGELVAVSDDCLAQLDEYEGVPNEYIRMPLELSDQPTSLKCEAYFLPTSSKMRCCIQRIVEKTHLFRHRRKAHSPDLANANKVT